MAKGDQFASTGKSIKRGPRRKVWGVWSPTTNSLKGQMRNSARSSLARAPGWVWIPDAEAEPTVAATLDTERAGHLAGDLGTVRLRYFKVLSNEQKGTDYISEAVIPTEIVVCCFAEPSI